MFRFHAKFGNELQPYRCHGSSLNISNLGFEIPINPKLTRKSSKVAWCHVMAHICRGKNIANLGQALLQTSYKPELLSKKPRGSDRETCPLVGQMIITLSFSLVFSSTRDTEQLEIHAKLWNYSGFV